MEFLGLTGFAQSGKDTAAKILVDYGWHRVAFADPMRRILLAVDPWVQTETCWCRVSDIVKVMGWDDAKVTYPEIRRLLQKLGTEGGRDVLGENVWVDAAFSAAYSSGASRIVFTDCRFVNEASAVLGAGGQVWRIDRPGIGPVNGHASDAGLDTQYVTGVIPNTGTIIDLRAALARFQ